MAVATPSAVADYASRVLAGDVPASRLVRLACERHLRDLRDGHARGLVFDDDAAELACDFFGLLQHSKGEWGGTRFALEAWQRFIVGSIFGWKLRDGRRRFRRAYVEIPRKNGKSTLSAGIGLYLLVADGEPGAEVYSAATKKDQAMITHGEAVRMVQASPSLRKRIGVRVNNLHVLATNSRYSPLSADANTMDGLNVHGAIIDELHAHPTRHIVDVLDTATGARRQPLIFEITTAGWDRLSVCWQHHEYSRQVAEGLVEDDTWFCYVAGADPGDDWQDEATWAKANPNLGVSVKLDDLRAKARRARQVPDEQNAFKRLHLDIWTEQAERWLDIEDWRASAGPADHAALPERLVGRPCWAGLDLSSTEDVAALVLVFPDDEEPVGYDVLCRFWVPEATVRRRTEKGNVPYARWVDEGLIDATDGNVIDYDAIEAAITGLADRYEIRELAYDPWNALNLITRLQAKGMEVVPIRQGFASLSAPTKHLQALVLSGRLHHGDNPVLTWMAGNMAVVSDPAGNIKPAKDKSSEKIDGMAALINAVARLIVQPAMQESVYERMGLFLPWDDEGGEDAEAAG